MATRSATEVQVFCGLAGEHVSEGVRAEVGMLVHSQSGFQMYYTHPESNPVCNYHPGFLVYQNDRKAHLIEVKSNWKRDDPVVLAKKEAAELLAVGNQFEYALVTHDQFDRSLGPLGRDKFQPKSTLDVLS